MKLNFRSRCRGGPLDGVVFPSTRDAFDAVRRGRSHDVDGDAFTELKLLTRRSAIFFLVDQGTDDAAVHGVFGLASRVELDRDAVDGGYFVKVVDPTPMPISM